MLVGITIAGLVLGGWAVLRILAAERELRIRRAEQARLEEVRRQLAAARRQAAMEAGRQGKSPSRQAA